MSYLTIAVCDECGQTGPMVAEHWYTSVAVTVAGHQVAQADHLCSRACAGRWAARVLAMHLDSPVSDGGE